MNGAVSDATNAALVWRRSSNLGNFDDAPPIQVLREPGDRRRVQVRSGRQSHGTTGVGDVLDHDHPFAQL